MRRTTCKARLWRIAYASLALYIPVAACAQTTNYPSGTTTTTSNGSSRANSANPGVNRSMGMDFPSIDPNFSHRQMVSRREDLKKHMVDNAARLLLLTRDLQTDLLTRAATEGDAKRLDEIAKLARTVRDQMRQ